MPGHTPYFGEGEIDTGGSPRDKLDLERSADRALVRSLIRQGARFPIAPERRAAWVQQLELIRQSDNDDTAIDAIRTLAALESMNQKDQHLAAKLALKLATVQDAAKTDNAINITQINIGAHLAKLDEPERKQWDEARKLLEELP